MGGAGKVSSIFNLTNTVIGAGVLSIPYAFRAAGWAAAIIILLMVWIASSYSFVILARCAEATQQFSYKGIAIAAYGRTAGIGAEVMIMLYCMGNLIGRIILIGDCLPALVQILSHATTDSPTPAPTTAPTAGPSMLTQSLQMHGGEATSTYEQRWFLLIIITSALLLPLSLLPKIEFLKYSSFFAVLCIVYVVFLVVEEYSTHKDLAIADHLGDLVAFRSSFTVFMAFPLLVVSFTAHYNLPRMYQELSTRTVGTMRTVVSTSTTVCMVAYLVMGQCGYMTFRDATVSNILKVSYINQQIINGHQILPILAYGALVCSISLSYPLVALAVRTAVMNIFFPTREFSWPFHILLTFLIVGTSLLVGLYVTNIGVVFAFMGSTVGVGFVYIMPGLFYIRLMREAARGSSLGDAFLPGNNEDGSMDRRPMLNSDMGDYKVKGSANQESGAGVSAQASAFPWIQQGDEPSVWAPWVLVVFGSLIGLFGLTATVLHDAGVIKL